MSMTLGANPLDFKSLTQHYLIRPQDAVGIGKKIYAIMMAILLLPYTLYRLVKGTQYTLLPQQKGHPITDKGAALFSQKILNAELVKKTPAAIDLQFNLMKWMTASVGSTKLRDLLAYYDNLLKSFPTDPTLKFTRAFVEATLNANILKTREDTEIKDIILDLDELKPLSDLCLYQIHPKEPTPALTRAELATCQRPELNPEIYREGALINLDALKSELTKAQGQADPQPLRSISEWLKFVEFLESYPEAASLLAGEEPVRFVDFLNHFEEFALRKILVLTAKDDIDSEEIQAFFELIDAVPHCTSTQLEVKMNKKIKEFDLIGNRTEFLKHLYAIRPFITKRNNSQPHIRHTITLLENDKIFNALKEVAQGQPIRFDAKALCESLILTPFLLKEDQQELELVFAYLTAYNQPRLKRGENCRGHLDGLELLNSYHLHTKPEAFVDYLHAIQTVCEPNENLDALIRCLKDPEIQAMIQSEKLMDFPAFLRVDNEKVAQAFNDQKPLFKEITDSLVRKKPNWVENFKCAQSEKVTQQGTFRRGNREKRAVNGDDAQ